MKHPQEGKWVYDTSNEFFTNGYFFDTKEEAIKEGEIDLTLNFKYDCPVFYVGQVLGVDLPISFDIDNILESIASSVCDEIGEVAEDYLNDVTNEHYEELENSIRDVVLKWMDKNNYNPEFYRVTKIEKVEHKK